MDLGCPPLPRALAPGLLALPLVACAPPEPDAPARRALLLSCDTLRADRLSAYGQSRDLSPRLDELAEEAVVFERAYSSASSTVPALSSLLASRLPDELGVSGGNQTLMHPAAVTLPEVLRDAGIPTGAIVSNWVLRRQPGRTDAGVTQGFGHFDDRVDTLESGRPVPERLAGETADAAIAWLADRARLGEDRFFLWVHFQDPHGPYTPPDEVLAEHRAALGDSYDAGELELPLGTSTSGRGQVPDYQVLDGATDPVEYVLRYDAEVRYFDAELGRVLEAVREAGWWSDTLVVFTADHGESLGEGGFWFSHGQHLGEEVVRVPLLVRFPERSGARQPARVEALASHLDVAPTIAEAFGLSLPSARGRLLAHELPVERALLLTQGESGTRRRHTTLLTANERLDRSARGDRLLDVTTGEPLNDEARAARLLEEFERLEASLEAPPAVIRREPNRRDEALLRSLGYTGED